MQLSETGNASGSICVVQLTDSHVFADEQQRLLGIDTCASLHAVIDQALQEQPQVDLVLATGDITQDGSASGYQRFMDAVARIPGPCYWLPGNHDDAALMTEIGQTHGLTRSWVDMGVWRIVMLDSSVHGAVFGLLDEAQLALLDEALAGAGQRHILVCLHHHPVSIGSEWMEPIGLRNADALWQRLDADPRVRAVLWGHVHQHLEQQRGSLRLLASPSTCVQFAVASHDFATDTQPPGYRWLRLYDDGRIDTAISRLPDGSFVPDPDAAGY